MVGKLFSVGTTEANFTLIEHKLPLGKVVNRKRNSDWMAQIQVAIQGGEIHSDLHSQAHLSSSLNCSSFSPNFFLSQIRLRLQ